MLKVAQDQHTDNQDALVVRLRGLLRPVAGDPASRNDLIVVSVENPLIVDADLAGMLSLNMTDLMKVWEARPISVFGCLHPSCRAPIPVRNRAYLLRLLRLDRYFGLRIGAGDLVEFKALREMLCDSCAHSFRHGYDEEHRAVLLARQARIAELRRMPFGQYRLTPEWRSLRNRVLLRAGNRCELCYESGRLHVHHRTYERYGQELLGDLIALCRSCHRHFHGILPKSA